MAVTDPLGSLSFVSPLYPGVLLKRYKRFMADVWLETGEEVTAHCPNTGAMRGLLEPGTPVFLSRTDAPGRKYPYTWENAHVEDVRVGVNTALPNRLVAKALSQGFFPELSAYDTILREAAYDENSRIDFLLRGAGMVDCYLEVKNVHWKEGRCALFPDSPTARGVKHMEALKRQVERGCRAIVLYVVQREDVDTFSFAHALDPLYGKAANAAYQGGVEMWAYACDQDSARIWFKKPLDLVYSKL